VPKHTLSLVDVTGVSADVPQAALEKAVVISQIGDGQPEVFVHREGSERVALHMRFANRRQAAVFVSASNTWRDPNCHGQLSEVHWGLSQAARLRKIA
jgi:hypothetical protein